VKQKIDPREWAEDFKLFLDAPKINPPAHVGEQIFRSVHRDFNPTLLRVLAKIGGIHVLGGSLSLFFCSQFGIGRGYNLMQVFMSEGVFACMALCGALFLGLTVLIAGFILSNSELKKIRKTCYAPVFLLGLASLAIFLCFGAEIALNLAFFWLVGAVAVGVLLTESSLRVRRFTHA
jgi:hypothetical protein